MPSGAFRRVRSATIVNNPVASSQTGTATARISGLSGLLNYGVAVAYFTTNRNRPSSFGANAFTLLQIAETEAGEKVQLSTTPINGATGLAAPDQWDVNTTLPELALSFAYVGMGAADIGRWDVIVTAVPGVDMCDADFQKLAAQLDISVSPVTLA